MHTPAAVDQATVKLDSGEAVQVVVSAEQVPVDGVGVRHAMTAHPVTTAQATTTNTYVNPAQAADISPLHVEEGIQAYALSTRVHRHST